MEKLLAIDIGNTNITAGFFRNGVLTRKAKIPTADHARYGRRFKAFIRLSSMKPEDVSAVIISSVAPAALRRLSYSLRRLVKCRVKIVGSNISALVRNRYRVKRQVGRDRLVNAFAAKLIYGAPCVIIDFGTAVTFDLVSKSGDYLGGLIMPGIDMSLQGLYEWTALLPRVRLKRAANIIGKDTAGSIRGGILFGLGVMCDGLVSRYKAILGKNLKVIATGGNAGLVKKYSKSIETVDEDLTLRGLYLIHNRMPSVK